MGALHKGHLSLIERSKADCDLTVVSIFVNPFQFSPHEDFNSYPRIIEQDKILLKERNVDVLFLPDKETVYPKNYSTYIEETLLGKKLEGLSRPHFFKGVLTVVLKLFNIIKPDCAYFGKKDMQQLVTIKKMVKDLNIDINIVGCKTIREKGGLAMSSRNQYLSKKRVKNLGAIYSALKLGKKEIQAGCKDSRVIKSLITKKLLEIEFLKIDYVEINNFKTLETVKKIDENVIISLAVFVDNVRLIDNIEVIL